MEVDSGVGRKADTHVKGCTLGTVQLTQHANQPSMRHRSPRNTKKMELQMKSVRQGYSEVPADEEGFPSSFTRRDERRAKAPFSWLRSYVLRRQLSFAGVASAFVAVGVLFSVAMHAFGEYDANGREPNSVCSERKRSGWGN